MKTYNHKYFLDKQFKNWDPNKFDWGHPDSLLRYCRKYTKIWKEDFKRMEVIVKLYGTLDQIKEYTYSNELDKSDKYYTERYWNDDTKRWKRIELF
tara:strand:+ start:1748 stop:2035 length:288 start_codon:yes stop_codon:yes gene_type:complete